MLEQVLVHEQLGQGTGGLWSYIPGAYNAIIHRTRSSAGATWSRLRGERFGSYAITEPGAGSDPRTLEATAERDPAIGEYVLNGEKWFVTGPPDGRLHDLPCLVVARHPADPLPGRLRHPGLT
ncbi:MAG: acyl-CoA dehydrogenase family protein [Candidatus Limnocylindrales bacterium]